jgi:hypothetical protein
MRGTQSADADGGLRTLRAPPDSQARPGGVAFRRRRHLADEGRRPSGRERGGRRRTDRHRADDNGTLPTAAPSEPGGREGTATSRPHS